jgi:FAD:protein FMN transferase
LKPGKSPPPGFIIALFVVVSLVLSLLLFSFYQKNSWKGETWLVMDTFFELQVPSSRYNKELKPAISNIIEAIDLELNVYREGSEIQILNQAATSKQARIKGKNLFKALKEALIFSELSSGLFDPSFEPLQNAYGFHDGTLRIPETDELSYLLQSLGWKNIILDEDEHSIRYTKETLKLNLSALIKGVVLDEIALYLDSMNIDEYVLNFGGSLKIKKDNPVTVMVQDPRKPIPAGKTRISSGCISTSSDGQQFFEKEGNRYSHIINPLTGSAQNPSQSITIYHPDSAMKADMLSTTLLLMERSEAISFLSKHFPEAGLLGIDSEGKFSWNMEWSS